MNNEPGKGQYSRSWVNQTGTELAQENARLRGIVASISDRTFLVGVIKNILRSKHSTLWWDWIIEEDKIIDGVPQPRGLTKAANEIADFVHEILEAVSPKDDPPLTAPE